MMERDVMDIIKDKEYIELTTSERAELGELCATEDEFNQVKSMFASINAINWSNPAPKAETKQRLDHLFAETYPKAVPVWYNAPLAILVPKGKPFYRQPLVQAAAVGLLIFLAYPFVNPDVMDAKANQVATLEKEDPTLKKRDTDKKSETKKNQETPTAAKNLELDQNQTIKSITAQVSKPSKFLSNGSADMRSDLSESKDSRIVGNSETTTIKPGSTHPDGIFMGDRAEIFSVPASRQPEVFDLLTSTF